MWTTTNHDSKIKNRKIRFMNGLFEILSNKEWMIQQEFLHGILPTLQYNITNHATLGIEREKKAPMAIGQQGQDFIREYQVTEDGNVLPTYDGWTGEDLLGKMKEPFVNVMPVDGPITRNGGACSYGSRDIRDWMMKAADNKFCQGHVLHINTPGGSAWAKNDFQQGIDYAHARGQRVIAFIDGLCASAGMYLASLCDEVYVMNPKDQLGCVGVMAAFCTMKNGDKDLSTGETYREYYDPESVDKNKEMRDIAEDEDATLLIEELKTLGEEFRADMKAAFPNAKDEHLKGKVFDAKDVMGILCDGQMMLGDVIFRVFDLANGTAQPIARTAGRKIGKRQQTAGRGTSAGQQASVGNGALASVRTAAAQAKENILSPTNNSINMKENYPAVFALLGVEEMQLSEEGTFFNKDLLATLNSAIEAKNKETADAKALAEQLTSEKNELTAQIETLNADHQKAIDDLKAEHAQAVETLNADHQKAIDDLKAEHATAIEEKDNQISALEQEKADLTAAATTKDEEIATLKSDAEGKASQIEQLTTDLNGAKESLTTAEGTIAERDQTINDLNAQIAELQNDPGAGAQAGAAPQNNGGGAEAPGVAVNQYVYDPSLSYEKNMEAKAKWEAEHK
jgi:ClpP class serine protease